MQEQTSTLDPAAVAVEYLTPNGRRRVLRQPKVEQIRQDFTIPYADGHISLRSWGTGPAVLLIHGWAGDQSDMFNYVPPLVEHYRVLTMDLPAHGESSGDTVSIEQIGDGILAAAQHIGPLKAAVGHSIGSAALTIAVNKGMQVERIALLSPPESYERFARYFAHSKGLSGDQVESMLQALKDAGVRVALRTSEMVAEFELPGLVVHSNDDVITPVKNAHLITEKWPCSTFMEVDQLGHRGVLRDKAVISAVCQFISAV